MLTKGSGSITATACSCIHSNYIDYEQVRCENFNNKEPSRFEYTSIPTDLVLLLLYVEYLLWRPSVGHRGLSHTHHICNCSLRIRNT